MKIHKLNYLVLHRSRLLLLLLEAEKVANTEEEIRAEECRAENTASLMQCGTNPHSLN
jgi:hypothetical protein